MERFRGARKLNEVIKGIFRRKPKNKPVVRAQKETGVNPPPQTAEGNLILLTPEAAAEAKRLIIEQVRSAKTDISILAIAQKGYHMFDVLPDLVQAAPPDIPVRIILQAPPGAENDSETLAAIRDLLEISGPRENVEIRLARSDPSFRPPMFPSNN